MRYIQEVDNPENLRALVTQDLKELGIRAPKVKKTKSKDAVAVSTPPPPPSAVFNTLDYHIFSCYCEPFTTSQNHRLIIYMHVNTD